MSGRVTLPDRRESISFWFTHEDIGGAKFRYHATVGFYAGILDGRVGEIFLNNSKVDSLLDVLASDSAVLASHLIQRGFTLSEIGALLKRNVDGSPASPLACALEIARGEYERAVIEAAALPSEARDQRGEATTP